MSESISLNITPGSAEYDAMPHDPPEGAVGHHAGQERRPSLVNIATGGAPGMPGLVGVISQFGAFGFLLILTWFMYRDNTTNTRDMISSILKQSVDQNTMMREMMDRQSAAAAAEMRAVEAKVDAANAEGRAGRVAIEAFTAKASVLIDKVGVLVDKLDGKTPTPKGPPPPED